jgi:hypothetical protein
MKDPMMGGPMPPKTDEKPNEADANAALGDTVEKTLDAAEQAGELAPLQAVVDEMGLDVTPRELFKYAQDLGPPTHGAKPDALAQMLREDDGLVDDIMRAKDADQRKSDSSAPEESFADVMRRKKAEPKPKKKEAPDDGADDEEEM